MTKSKKSQTLLKMASNWGSETNNDGSYWRPRLTNQSSDEREDSVKRVDSEGESDTGPRGSPYGPSDQSDGEQGPPRRYSKRPLRGPYGMMLEAEMNKPRPAIDDGKPAVHHQRTTSSPSQLEGCKQLLPSHQLLAQLLKGSSERSLSQPKLPTSDTAIVKDTRTHVVFELYETEKSYVESLQILVMKYLQPLKNWNVCQVDSALVDEIFYKVPAILALHEVFLDELRKRIENWDLNQRIGDLFLETFTKSTVIETYTEFISNWKNAKEAIKSATQAKPAFARFLENMAREHKGKLALDSLLIMPVQRIPRYELLIQTLLKHTEACHGDVGDLTEALRAVHELAVSINLGRGAGGAASQELAQLEAVVEGAGGLQAPHRSFLSHDLVTISTAQGRKDRALFLFSDLLLISSIKRKSTTVRKTALTCPGSIVNSLDGNKYKLLMKIPLHDLDIVKAKDDSVRRMLKEMEQLTADVGTLSQMAELVATLHCPHSQLEESVRDMLGALNKQLTERHAADTQLSFLELTVTTQSGVESIVVSFSKPEKRTAWEEIFLDAKQRLGANGERRQSPELLCAVPIRKTRAGLQFTCASPTPSPAADIWVCNSDGYVGQVCVLTLSPEPTVTSCNGVCNARILCIAPVPGPTQYESSAPSSSNPAISISVEDTDKTTSNIHLDSSSSDEEEVAECDTEAACRGTMWLGTEDGCVHVYSSSDNIRTKKNKLKIQHAASVHAILYLDNRVFVALANGDVIVYFRDNNGGWNTSEAVTLTVGSPGLPVTHMVPVGGKLWCSYHTNIKILNSTTFLCEHSFVVTGDGGRCVSCITAAGNSVWIALHNSAAVKLFHAYTYEWITEVNVSLAVTKMLGSCDDIIRQHKAACLRVTSLLACKDLLWVGTSAGVILTLPLPPVSPTSAKLNNNISLNVSGVPHGHTGHVRFLTMVETTHHRSLHKRNQSKFVVISGGDGYEDFRSSSVSEVAGREDSTNHLLLWYI